MEIGLELQSIRFHRPGCYRLAVVCRVGERRLVHVSEPSEICAAPKWKTTAWRLQVQKDDVELQLQLRFYDGNSSDCRSLLEEAPLSCCSFGLLLQRLRSILSSSQVCSAPLFSQGKSSSKDIWEEIGVVTISFGWPTSSHTELVVPERLKVSSENRNLAPATQLEKLQNMNQASRQSLHLVATRLSAMQQVLNALTAHQADLLKEQDEQLSVMKRLELTLKEMKEPYLTDLDIELMLSMPHGARKMANILLAAEQRWKNAREDVIGRWAEFTSLRQKLAEVQHLQQQFNDFQKVHKEQQKVLSEASRRALTARDAAATCASQAKLMEELKVRSAECAVGLPAELKLIHGREQQMHAVLQEKSHQLGILVGRGRPEDSKADWAKEHQAAHLASELYQRTRQVMQLLKQIKLLQRPRRAKGAPQAPGVLQKPARALPTPSGPSTFAERMQVEDIGDGDVQEDETGPDLLDEAVQAMIAAQLRCEDLERRNASVEAELLRRQVGSWGQEPESRMVKPSTKL